MTYDAIIITGPTASGKSDFAHRMAQYVNGAIINCDSVQMYRDIENIAASPLAGRNITDNIDGVPYKLFSVLPLSSQISVGQYLDMARDAYNDAISHDQMPIFVGGTGYYINALINGISPMPEISDENRKRARDMVANDIHGARQLLPDDFNATDPQRIARAIEVFLETGMHLTEFQKKPRVGAILKKPYKILICPDTNILRERIAARIPQMLAGGAMDEAQTIINSNWDENRAIGAAQLCKFIRGEISEDECMNNWVNKTNQYAKRQRTWFRTQFSPDLIISDPEDTDLSEIVKNRQTCA